MITRQHFKIIPKTQLNALRKKYFRLILSFEQLSTLQIIHSYTGDKRDRELYRVMETLKALSGVHVSYLNVKSMVHEFILISTGCPQLP